MPIADKFRGVAERAAKPETRTDMTDRARVSPPLTQQQLDATIDALGFAPPDAMVEIMQSIGNGGFGPGYGMMGLIGGDTDDTGKNAVELYRDFSLPDEHDTAWQWPEGLLPICHWGCAIYSCIDCTSDDAKVVTWDPNQWEPGTKPHSALFATDLPFERWIIEWGDGVNHWETMFPVE